MLPLIVFGMFRLLIALLLSGGLACLSAYADSLAGPVRAEVLKVIDGDTIKVRAEIWLDQSIEVSVRLKDVDAPEIRRPDCTAEKELGQSAKDLVNALTPVGTHITLTNVSRDKYAGRVVANVETRAGEALGVVLVRNGKAVKYGTRHSWCGV